MRWLPGMPWLPRMRWLSRLRRLWMQSLPMRLWVWRLWRLRHWLDRNRIANRNRIAMGSMRRLLCIVGRLPLVLGRRAF